MFDHNLKKYRNTMQILRQYNCFASDLMFELLLITHNYYPLAHYGRCIAKHKFTILKTYRDLDDNTVTALQYSFGYALNQGYRVGYKMYNELRQQDLKLPSLVFIDFFVIILCLCTGNGQLIDQLKLYTYREFSEILSKLNRSNSLVIKKCSG